MTLAKPVEHYVFFDSEGTTLAGILTVPIQPTGLTVLIPWGAGAYPSSGRNRLRTRLARELAERGFHSFRFDYVGVGESDGDYRPALLDSPYIEEIVASTQWLSAQGLSPIVIVANCFGAWSSLMAVSQIQDLAGIALLNCPVRRDHHESRATKASWRWWLKHLRELQWVNLRSRQHRSRYRRMVASKASSLMSSGSRRGKETRFSRAVRSLLDAGTPVLMMYGTDGFRADADIELGLGLKAAIESAAPPSRVVTVAERLEGFATLESQDVLVRHVLAWAGEMAEKLGLDSRNDFWEKSS